MAPRFWLLRWVKAVKMGGMQLTLKLKPNVTARVLRGHPWVFANEVTDLLPAESDGEIVECRDSRGRFLGSGIYNSRSQIVWRRLSRERVALDEAWLREALRRAIGRRDPAPEDKSKGGGVGSPGLPPNPAGAATADAPRERFCRLVWSESDDLPGVVVDQFADTLVVQTQTLAMERRLNAIIALLDELVQPAEIVIRNDASIRRLEGLPLEVRTRSGRPWEPRGCGSTGSNTGSICRAAKRPASISTNAGSMPPWRPRSGG